MSVAFNIPFNGSFSRGSSYTPFYTRNVKSDLVQLGVNTFIGIFQQTSQNIAYIGSYTFADYQNSDAYTTNTQQVFFVDAPIGAARLYRLSDTRVALIRDRGLYVYNVSDSDIVEEYRNDTYFSIGHRNSYVSFYSYGSDSFLFEAWNISDNELLVIENTETINVSTGVPSFVLRKLVFDTVNSTWSSEIIFDFDTLSNSENFRANFAANIQPIPDSSDFYIYFSPRITVNSGQVVTMVWNARISSSGTILETYPIPETVSTGQTFTPRFGVALGEDRVIFHDRMFSTARHWNGIEMKQLTNLSGNTTNDAYINNLIPLDSTHYFISNKSRTTVVRLLSSNLYQARDTNLSTSQILGVRKNYFNKINNNLITLFGSSYDSVKVGDVFLHTYRFLRLYQPN